MTKILANNIFGPPVPLFIKNIIEFIDKHNLVPKNSSIIIGLSGGPDSLFLLYLLHSLEPQKNVNLIAAHLDHQWRNESWKDVQFCKNVCDKFGIKFISATADQLPDLIKNNGSKEEIGRNMRRYFLQQVRKDFGAVFIALGHHLQDQEESFFIRLIRGTTLSGLTGIKPCDDVYIRPLLQTHKKDIIKFLDDSAIAYLIDHSNTSQAFLRNRIRHKVLPALKECDDRFDNNFLQALESLQGSDEYLQKLTSEAFFQVMVCQEGKWLLDIKKFFALHLYLQNRLLLHWLITEQVRFTLTQSFLQEIKRFLAQPENKIHAITRKWHLDKKKGFCNIRKKLITEDYQDCL